MTFSVLIVEDEILILNNIVKKINNLELPLTIAGTATNGNDALMLVEKQQPDIVITDIRMPGMDGITLCKILHEQYPKIRLAILSGYDDFSFAQKAIQYQVSDYLLKPVNQQQLFETMSRLCDILEKEALAAQHRRFLLNISGQDDQNGLPSDFGTRPLGVTLICMGNLLNIVPEDISLSHFSHLWEALDLENYLKGIIPPANRFWLLPEKRPNERFLITSFFDVSFIASLSDYIQNKLPSVPVSFCTMSDGVIYPDIWKTAQKERLYMHSHLIPCHSGIYIEDSSPQTESTSADNILQLIISAIREQQLNSYQTAVTTFLRTLRGISCSQSRMEYYLENILKTLCEQSTLHNEYPFARLRNLVLSEICMQNDRNLLDEHLYRLLDDAFSQAFINEISGDTLSVSVKKYIDHNYQEHITMESLADHFHFSASYINKMFRSQFGVPPMKYLLNLRIEKACALIKENEDLGIGSIGEMVRYSDSRYFSRIFRSVTGLTPSAYKKRDGYHN